ncbi:MAG: hypothetical protein A2017_08230 [Lentisphaerae bacterium GWF2_44_16]|nr:MAG: hypothetical protein A2017_08230 [Lentisphaerae bacterium GWF2_44_16]
MNARVKAGYSIFLSAIIAVAMQTSVISQEKNSELYVSLKGNDNASGTRELPFRSIQHAVKNAVPGTAIYVHGGVYNESVYVDKSGTSEKYITIQNYPGEKPVLDLKFEKPFGFAIEGSYIIIRGFEIKNVSCDMELKPDIKGNPPSIIGGVMILPPAHHCRIENNLIHHIIGNKKKTPDGIYVENGTDFITIKNNTIHNVAGRTEAMGILACAGEGFLISNNLVYFCDKEGIRIMSRKYDSENTVENNIVLYCHMGISFNSCWSDRKTVGKNNFCGWNWGRGMNPKHTKNVVLEHNTIYGNEEWGIDIHGNGQSTKKDNTNPRVMNNIFSMNSVSWLLLRSQIFSGLADYNFYQYKNGAVLGAFSSEPGDVCYNLNEVREKTKKSKSFVSSCEMHGIAGDPMFTASERFDFRLNASSPAKNAGSDGRDMGVLEEALKSVGADGLYSLAKIPDLGKIKATVESFSSETPEGKAANLVDGNRNSFWEVDCKKDKEKEVIFKFPAEYEIENIIITKYGGGEKYFYKDFELYYLGNSSGDWKKVPPSPEHPFSGFGIIYNGEIWTLPPSIKTQKLKLKIFSSYGETIRIPEILFFKKNK